MSALTPPPLPAVRAPAGWRRWPGLRGWLARRATRVLQRELARPTLDPVAIRAALEHGANANAVVERPSSSATGVPSLEPALVAAARRGCIEALGVLRAAGADLEARGQGLFDRTALGTAVRERQWVAARWLLLQGADEHCAVDTADPASLAGAMALGGLDPSRIRFVDVPLWDLLTGAARCLRDDTVGKPPLRQSPDAQALVALRRAQALAHAWEAVPAASASPVRARL